MAQGSSLGRNKGAANRRAGKNGGKNMQKRKGAPAKQRRRLRDKKVTKMLHKNIESLAAAKAVKYSLHDSDLKLKDIKEKGSKQLKVEESKRDKKRSEEEKQIRQLKKATKRLTKS